MPLGTGYCRINYHRQVSGVCVAKINTMPIETRAGRERRQRTEMDTDREINSLFNVYHKGICHCRVCTCNICSVCSEAVFFFHYDHELKR